MVLGDKQCEVQLIFRILLCEISVLETVAAFIFLESIEVVPNPFVIVMRTCSSFLPRKVFEMWVIFR